ncbi:N-6 DNA methylase [Sulfitobacter sp. G21635-S1]|uniref:class I SAM-dependent DNA methyltransferase n=1 Tax=Sulfitobacter sp. G21635-S1 TaxID=3014043 RepID=UPI0022AE645D|nr:N-6 DNA methylase [Sulfitobacter sp. G21635-S1]MCZ4258845.1 N-6 DNA methylase [Sulfitobacter sp. G21635-S1]
MTYSATRDGNIVQKVWDLCHILRGDGVSYHQYVTELTYLLFLKIAEENGVEHLLPAGCRWKDLIEHPEHGLLEFYQMALTQLGTTAESEVIRSIYAFPTTVFSHSVNLRAVVDGINDIGWNVVDGDRFGEIYEGLVERISQDVRSGAGQYFTPRALVNSIVRIMKPGIGENIQDPAVGSGGFLVAADRYVRSRNSVEDYAENPPRYQGAEIEKNTRRICLMNTFLNQLDAQIIYGDALTDDGKALIEADLILANPPFGSKAGSRRETRNELPFPKANKQLVFLQHIYLSLGENGRAAVVLPDNVLFDSGAGSLIRKDLLAKCRLHTILRLPNGIFSSAGVKTNVLFFNREHTESDQAVWFYDLRANMPSFGKTNSITARHFEEFERLYGDDPFGGSKREEQGEEGRWRKLSWEQIVDQNYNLDWTWLRDDSRDVDDALTDPDEIAAAIMVHLRAALDEIEALSEELEDIPDLEPKE